MSSMHKLLQYFSKFDGKSTWAEIEPLYEALFHKDVKIAGKDATHDYQVWKGEVQKMADAKLIIQIFEIMQKEDGILMKGELVKPDGTVIPTTTKFVFQEDNMLIKTEPMDPAIYDKIKI